MVSNMEGFAVSITKVFCQQGCCSNARQFFNDPILLFYRFPINGFRFLAVSHIAYQLGAVVIHS